LRCLRTPSGRLDVSWKSIGNGEIEEAGSHVSMSKDGNVVSCSKSISIDGALSGSPVLLEENSTGWNVADIVVAFLGNHRHSGRLCLFLKMGNGLLLENLRTTPLRGSLKHLPS
jgi:hypothetical protein